MPRSVAAEARIDLPPEEALRMWTDPDRWPTFIEGFARVVERSELWPEEGGRLVWESKPEGRGRVTEKVTGRGPALIRTQVFEDRLSGEQTARFEHGRFRLELDYSLTTGSPLAGLTDVLFIKRALRDMLRRTVHRFAVESEEEAGLR